MIKDSTPFWLSKNRDLAEEATWDIRAELRRKDHRPDKDRHRNALKWNLLLHLAHEIQEEGKEAEEMLRTLKRKDSPLKGVIEEEEGPRASVGST